MINNSHLRTFLVLADTCHFTQTAEMLNMTQPGVSQHLKALETELNASLFHRHGKKMELTAAGERFLQYAREQVEAERNLREILNDDSPYEGECRITCSGSMATQLYTKLLELQKQHVGLKISLEAAPNDTSIELIKKNEFDIGLVTCFVDDPDIQTKKIGHEELCLVLPKGQSDDWVNLMALGYINHPNGEHYASQVLGRNYLDEFSGFKKISQKGYINQLNQILLPVSQGLGFTVLPESTVDQFLGLSLLAKAALHTPCRENVYYITKKYKALPNRYRLVEDCLNDLW